MQIAGDIAKNVEVSAKLCWSAHGPRHQVVKYNGYVMHGVRFHTKSHDSVHQYQNCGVSLDADAMQIASLNDRNPIVGDMIFYGVINEIWTLDYTDSKEVVFKFEWVNNNMGIKVDELGFILVD